MLKTPMTYAKSTHRPTAYWLHLMINVWMFCFYWQHFFFCTTAKTDEEEKEGANHLNGQEIKSEINIWDWVRKPKSKDKKKKQTNNRHMFFRNFSSDIVCNANRKFCAQIKSQFNSLGWTGIFFKTLRYFANKEKSLVLVPWMVSANLFFSSILALRCFICCRESESYVDLFVVAQWQLQVDFQKAPSIVQWCAFVSCVCERSHCLSLSRVCPMRLYSCQRVWRAISCWQLNSVFMYRSLTSMHIGFKLC